MMRSLFAGVSGLRNHQTRMDVIGNNVANVNTLAFKSGRVTFQESFAQTLSGAVAPGNGTGGINAKQVGLGSQVGSIDTLFTQGNIENTGISTDLAIRGDSFFVVSDGARQFYTRAGNFQLDADGRLVNPTTGFVLQGRMAGSDGVLVDSVRDIQLPFGQKTPAAASRGAVLGGNLDSGAATGTVEETSIIVYDSLGAKHDLKVQFTKTATPNQWNWSVDTSTLTPAEAATVTGGTGVLNFNNDGTLNGSTSTFAPIAFQPAGGAAAMAINLTGGTGLNAISQFAGRTTAILASQDGYAAGTLADFQIDTSGTISGSFTNGVTVTLGQIALADFNNPGGLERAGDNMWGQSPNSGEALVGFAREGSTSLISSGALEASNVDLAQEFTNMIVAQRGFQANGRVITTADEMLQDVVQLKR
jgi:flagellar hook protein FlgE